MPDAVRPEGHWRRGADPNAKPLLDFTGKPNQKGFFYDTSRTVAFFGGYGNGKTYAGSGKLYLLMDMFAGNVGLVGRKTYPALNSTTRESFLGIVRKRNGGTLEPGPIVASLNRQDNILTMRNGSTVYFRTLDEVEKLRSLNLGAVLIDQVEEIDEEIYLELQGRIRFWSPERVKDWQAGEAGQAAAARFGFMPTPYNQIICVGNPSPKAWVRREFHENPGKRNKVFHASTLENKKYLPVEYVTELSARYPKEWIERFINGSWETMLGQIYKELDLDRIHACPSFDIPAHWHRFIALDFGIVNATAALWGAVDEAGRVFIYREYYQAGKTLDEHCEAIKALCAQDGSTPLTEDGKILLYADPSIKGDYDPHGKTTWEHFNERGIFCRAANNEVLTGIQNVQMYLHPHEGMAFPSQHPRSGERPAPRLFISEAGCPWLCRELKAYEWEPTKEGQNAPEKPRKHFDHACDSLRYLLAAVRDTRSAPAPTQDAEQKAMMEAMFRDIYTSPEQEADPYE